MTKKRKTKDSYRLACGCLVTDTAFIDKGMCAKCQKEFDDTHDRWIHEKNNPIVPEKIALNSKE